VTNSLATTAGAVEREPEPPPLLVERVLRRGRLSVAFRLLLAVPQFIVLYVLALVGWLVLIVGWFAALIFGRLPEPIAQFLGYLTGYYTRFLAYLYLLTDRYPPFQLSAPDYPVRVELAPGRLNRLAVLFRLILAIPAQILASLVLGGFGLAIFFIWLVVLVLGRVPESLFDATTAILRYAIRCYAYVWLLTAAYPWGLFGDRTTPSGSSEDAAAATPGAGPAAAAGYVPGAASAPGAVPAESAESAEFALAGPTEELETSRPARRLVLSPGAKRLVILFLVLGVVAQVVGGTLGLLEGSRTASDARPTVALVSAHDTLTNHSQKYQQDVAACNQQISCVQKANGELAAAFEAFATEVDGLEFRDSARDEAENVAGAAHQLSGALQGLVAASSPEEYTRLAAGVDRIGASFDQRYEALADELSR
jgi:hypothetical protein